MPQLPGQERGTGGTVCTQAGTSDGGSTQAIPWHRTGLQHVQADSSRDATNNPVARSSFMKRLTYFSVLAWRMPPGEAFRKRKRGVSEWMGASCDCYNDRRSSKV